jgi:hypothetical protein
MGWAERLNSNSRRNRRGKPYQPTEKQVEIAIPDASRREVTLPAAVWLALAAGMKK